MEGKIRDDENRCLLINKDNPRLKTIKNAMILLNDDLGFTAG